MKQNAVQKVIRFGFKYIWIVCALLIIIEMISVSYTSSILMQQSATGVLQSVSGDISGRVEGVLRLLSGMAEDEAFANISEPLFDRAIKARPYQTSFNLYMIALTDENVYVVSADETEPPTENSSLAYRDYMKALYSTGQPQITDAFLSGDGKERMNYTIAVPIKAGESVVGSIFGSIYFQDIEEIVQRQSQNSGRDFYLFGAENTIMASGGGDLIGDDFLSLSGKSYIFNNDASSIELSMREGSPGDFWEWDNEGLAYVVYQQVAPTSWTLFYRVNFVSVLIKLLPSMCVKILFYILTCGIIFVLGRRYLDRQFAQVSHMLNRMAAMQKELFQSEQPDYDSLLTLTQQGLTDHLTGLSTRAVLFNSLSSLVMNSGTVALIDLDDLKKINDHFGHDGGDCALICFAQVLKRYEQKYGGIAARYGGDEFVLILTDTDNAAATAIVANLCHDLNTMIVSHHSTFSVHGSVGVSYYPDHGESFEDLICKADLALYEAKQRGKKQYAVYSESSVVW